MWNIHLQYVWGTFPVISGALSEQDSTEIIIQRKWVAEFICSFSKYLLTICLAGMCLDSGNLGKTPQIWPRTFLEKAVQYKFIRGHGGQRSATDMVWRPEPKCPSPNGSLVKSFSGTLIPAHMLVTRLLFSSSCSVIPWEILFLVRSTC